jgi:hypothetical protein
MSDQSTIAKQSGPTDKFVSSVVVNTKSALIEITGDKLENILLKHEKNLSKTTAWVTPISLFVTFLLVFLTADFKDFMAIDKATWKAVFLLALIISGIWTLYAIIEAFRHSKKSTIDFLINEIKNEQKVS